MVTGQNSSSLFKYRNLPLLMLQARECVVAQFRPILHEEGLTEQQWRVLRLLLDTGPLEPREIGMFCQLSSPSLTGVLRRMEGQRLVNRKRFKNDQRRVHVSLTARSRQLAARIVSDIDSVYARLDHALGKSGIAKIYDHLDALVATLQITSDNLRDEKHAVTLRVPLNGRPEAIKQARRRNRGVESL